MIILRTESLTASSVKTCHGGREHLLLRNEVPRNLKTSLHSQFSNEFALGSSVSLAKRMQSVDLAKVASGALAESTRVNPSRKLLAGELMK
jgi:hypothetical protein